MRVFIITLVSQCSMMAKGCSQEHFTFYAWKVRQGVTENYYLVLSCTVELTITLILVS